MDHFFVSKVVMLFSLVNIQSLQQEPTELLRYWSFRRPRLMVGGVVARNTKKQKNKKTKNKKTQALYQ